MRYLPTPNYPSARFQFSRLAPCGAPDTRHGVESEILTQNTCFGPSKCPPCPSARVCAERHKSEHADGSNDPRNKFDRAQYPLSTYQRRYWQSLVETCSLQHRFSLSYRRSITLTPDPPPLALSQSFTGPKNVLSHRPSLDRSADLGF